ncbi:chromosome segregation protein Spc25-domain-containing protein [Zopfochytrium polystomum]|nr:chromosome segregation protein Spc25-domain-containing protein [Zopfochytrium polystomum]
MPAASSAAAAALAASRLPPPAPPPAQQQQQQPPPPQPPSSSSSNTHHHAHYASSAANTNTNTNNSNNTTTTPTPTPTDASLVAAFDAAAASFDALSADCLQFNGALDAWAAARKRAMRDAAGKHVADLQTCRDRYVICSGEIKACKAKFAQAEKVVEAERREEADMESVVESLSEKRALKERDRAELEEKVKSLEEEVRSRRAKLEQTIRKREEEAARSVPEMLLYEEKLAMKIVGLKVGVLRFVFTHINKNNWNEEFAFVVDVSGGSKTYQIIECTPRLPTLDSLVKFLNDTRDFFRFLKEIRKEFVEFCRHSSHSHGGGGG